MIEIYGRPNCTYCHKATEFLNKNKIEYNYHNIDNMDRGEVLKLIEKVAPGAKTVPIVIDNGEYIGGFNELRHKYK